MVRVIPKTITAFGHIGSGAPWEPQPNANRCGSLLWLLRAFFEIETWRLATPQLALPRKDSEVGKLCVAY
jgi:hypothetical protein